MTLRIGALLPTSTPDPARPFLGDVRAAARLAEQGGLDSVWAPDHLIASAPILDSTVALAVAAAVTERIGLGYGVLLLGLRPPAWAAKAVSSLQYVSGDRLLLGVGTGNPAHGDLGWRAAEQSFADRGRRTDASLRVLPDLIAGRAATLSDGTVATLSPGATVPPILVAGDGPRARRRAAEFADGWLGIGQTPEQVRQARAELAALAAEFGRPTPSITIVVPPAGAVRETADQLAEYTAAGVERVLLAPCDQNWPGYLEFAAEVRAAM
ncbi:LLM class flavin-dependent oxidoreductase [Nocardia sp. NPDC051570]|uniref:LLM class flavin-dependent oxidoreductase n=1 Tax=Nocardia sp. NPDC051570 TaxID=3364324 RepID=UPI0037AF98BB